MASTWYDQHFDTLLVGVWNSTALLKNYWAFPNTVKHIPILKLVTSFPGCTPRETSAYVHKKTCPRMFMATLCVIVENWKRSKYPT